MSSQRLKKRVDFFEDYISLINQIESLISYNAIPLDEIVFGIHSGDGIAEFTNSLKTLIENGENFHNAWKRCVNELNLSDGISEDDKTLFNDFGRGLGITDISGQVAHCNLSLSMANSRLSLYREEKATKTKLYRTLGILSGIAVALLII